MSTEPDETRRDAEWAARVETAVMKPVAEEPPILLRPLGLFGIAFVILVAGAFLVMSWVIPPRRPLGDLDVSQVTAYWAGPFYAAPFFHEADSVSREKWDDLLIERSAARAEDEDPLLDGLVAALSKAWEGSEMIPAAGKDRVLLLRLADDRILTLWVGRSEGPVPVSGSYVAADGAIEDVQGWSNEIDDPLADLETLVARIRAESAAGALHSGRSPTA